MRWPPRHQVFNSPFLLVSSPNHHSYIPFTISCSPFPPFFFFFTPPLSSGLAAMLSSEPFQLNEREITQFIQIRDTVEYFHVFLFSPGYQLSEQSHTGIQIVLLWWTHDQDMGLSGSTRNNMEEEAYLFFLKALRHFIVDRWSLSNFSIRLPFPVVQSCIGLYCRVLCILSGAGESS